MLVKRVFKKQMKQFAVDMLEEYAKTTDNDVDDQLVLRVKNCLLYTSPSPRDVEESRMPSSA